MTPYPLYKSALDALEEALKREDGDAIEQAVKQLFAAQDAEMAQGSSDVEGTWLQFKGMSLAIAYHLFKGDSLSAVYHFMVMADQLQYVKDTAPFSPADIWNIDSLVVRTARRLRSALRDDMEAYKEALDLYCKDDKSSEAITEAPLSAATHWSLSALRQQRSHLQGIAFGSAFPDTVVPFFRWVAQTAYRGGQRDKGCRLSKRTEMGPGGARRANRRGVWSGIRRGERDHQTFSRHPRRSLLQPV